GESELLPLAETDIDAVGPGWSELSFETVAEARDHIIGAGFTNRRFDSGQFLIVGQIAYTDGIESFEFEPEEILKCAREARAPRVGRDARKIHAVDEYASLRWLIHAAQQFHQGRLPRPVLADDGHHG